MKLNTKYMQVPEGVSPMKSNMKGPKSWKESLSSSPALPPKPPRPSPTRNTSTLAQMSISHGHGNGGSTKRKINWDTVNGTSADQSTGSVFMDPSGGDNGVKAKLSFISLKLVSSLKSGV